MVKCERVMAEVNDKDIKSEISLIFGLPGQSIDSFVASVKWCQSVAPTRIRAFPLMLHRGTNLHDRRVALQLSESTEIKHPAVDAPPGTPIVISSPSFTFDEWKIMADIAASLETR
eukprot:CAMPEP_0117865266 /NCGR_PEP_ID=MMETSP0950-20121206/6636_1 /TAXON_ID=44440 /ORGANISM="Chattonella subsalsa, Strain CCMP2191" /LENGTH=115 /DNA_ID=CAMNT_0005716317 /DNA_START=77 /DNA_END=424 /DNA_ORIENTATION=+